MNKSKKNAFTLIELVAVLVIMAIISLIATPLVLTLVNNAKASANKRSVDAFGKTVEIAAMTYLMDNHHYPSDLSTLEVEYTGNEVTCEVMHLNEDGSLYLSECSVGGKEVKDKNTEDGWYHYGKFVASTKANTAVDELLAKANDASVTTYEVGTEASRELYTFSHDATAQTEALTDYRYIGNDPYNYVTFNNELWRIIGVFTVEDEIGNQEQRIKIIRDEIIGEYPWDYQGKDVDGAEYGYNKWPDSSLSIYLNGNYFNSLTSEAQSMITSAKFYIGKSYSVELVSAPAYYAFERGKSGYNGTIGNNWIGNIGLMYPSDYAYTYANGVDEKCFSDIECCDESTPTNSWLYKREYDQWTISPYSDDVISLNDMGIFKKYTSVLCDYGVRPSLYLKSDIQIVEGNGSQEAPYQLKLN